MPLFMLDTLCEVNKKKFLFDWFQKMWYVRFVEVKFHLKAKVSVRFIQMSALERPLYKGNFMKIWPKNGRANSFD